MNARKKRKLYSKKEESKEETRTAQKESVLANSQFCFVQVEDANELDNQAYGKHLPWNSI